MTDYGYQKQLACPFDEALDRITRALAAEGFGILTTIDVKATLKKKLDTDFRPYTILGACNPGLAHRALQADPQIGLLLPCNVVVQAAGEGTLVSIAKPEAMLAASGSEAVKPVADEADARLRRVIEAV